MARIYEGDNAVIKKMEGALAAEISERYGHYGGRTTAFSGLVPTPQSIGMAWMDSGVGGRKGRYDELRKLIEVIPVLWTAAKARAAVTLVPDGQTDAVVSIATQNNRVAEILDPLPRRLELPHRLISGLLDRIHLGDGFFYVVSDGAELIDFPVVAPDRIDPLADKDDGSLIGYEIGEPRRNALGGSRRSIARVPFYLVMHLKDRSDALFGASDMDVVRSHARLLQEAVYALVIKRIYHSVYRTEKYVEVPDGASAKDRAKLVNQAMIDDEYVKFLDSSGVLNTRRAGTLLSQLTRPDYIPYAKGDTPQGNKYHEGSNTLNQIDDIAYLRDEVLSVMMVPKKYLGLEKDTVATATVLAQDKMLVKACLVDQARILDQVLYPLFNMALWMQGIDPRDPANEYKIRLAKLDISDEKMLSEVMRNKAVTFDILTRSLPVKNAVEVVYPEQWTDDELVEMYQEIEALAADEQAAAAAVYVDKGPREAKRIMEAAERRLADQGVKMATRDVQTSILSEYVRRGGDGSELWG